MLLLGLFPALRAQYPQSPTPGNYKPPALSFSAIFGDNPDPGIQKAFTHIYKGDGPGFQAELRSQAETGNAAAQLMLGEQYLKLVSYAAYRAEEQRKHSIPESMISMQDHEPPQAAFYPQPDDAEALHWLKLASAQGSGEASEIIAQAIERGAGGNLTTADAQRYRALAILKGYDLENLETTNLKLTHYQLVLECKLAAISAIAHPQKRCRRCARPASPVRSPCWRK